MGDLIGQRILTKKNLNSAPGHLTDGLNDRGAEKTPCGEINNAVIADHLNVLRNKDTMISQKGADSQSKSIGIAENPVKVELTIPYVLFKKTVDRSFGLFVIDNDALVFCPGASANILKSRSAQVSFTLKHGTDTQEEKLLTPELQKLLCGDLPTVKVVGLW